MLHAQPSANHEQPLPHPGVLGHRRAVDVSRQAQLAFPYYTTYLPQGTTAHTYFIHTRSRSESHSQTQPREQNPKSTHTPDNSSSCALPGPGNIINNTNKHTQPDPLACSLARTHASTHARNTSAEAAEQETPIGSVFIYCTSTLSCLLAHTAWLACIASCTSTKHRTVPHPLPRHPSLVDCSYKTAPDFHFLARSASAARPSKN